MARGSGWFVAVTLAVGLAVAGAGNAILIYLLDQPVNWLASVVTTLVVGGFVSLVILGRKDRQDAARAGEDGEAGEPAEAREPGFDVVERRVR